MKKRFLKLCALTMAMAIVVTGCSKTPSKETSETPKQTSETPKETSETPKGTNETPSKQEIVDINVMVYDRGDEYSPGNSLTDNELTRWINEQMNPQGVRVNFVPVPRSGADDKVNLMLTAGTAPDIIRTYDRQRVSGYAKQGGLLDLGPYVDRLDKDFVANNQQAFEFTRFNDGQYALPGIFSYHGKSHETFLRQDLVEKMGMQMPTNRAELINVLYAMKENFPDIIPYAFSGKITNGNYTNFILSYTSRSNERDNYIYEPTFTIVLKPGHKEGLKQLNQFVLDGIISPDFVLDVDSTKYNENIANGKVGFVMDGSSDSITKGYKTVEDPNYRMVEVDVIENADGNFDVPSQDALSHYVYVPKASEKKVDAIMKYLAFLSNEENAIQVSNGVLGKGYDLVDGIPVARSKEDRIKSGTSPNPNDSNFLIANFSYNKNRLVDNFIASNPDVPVDVAQGKIASQYSNYYDRCLIPAALETDEYVPLLQTLIVEFVFKVMSAPEGRFEEVYQTEYQILLDNNLQEVLDERAAWYDANMK